MLWTEIQAIFSKRSALVPTLLGAVLGGLLVLLIMGVPFEVKYALIGVTLPIAIMLPFVHNRGRFFSIGLLAVLALAKVYASQDYMRETYENPHEWDFLCWYLHGNVAETGKDFYDPQSYHQILKEVDIPMTPSEDFYGGLINVSFHYPPPTMFFFLPMGKMSFAQAHLLWLAGIAATLAMLILISYRMHFTEWGLLGLLIAFNFLLWPRPARTAIGFSQTTFLMLFWITLTYEFRERGWGGVFLAIAIFTKPLAAVFGLWFLLRGKWKALAWAAAIGAVGMIMSVMVFGLDITMGYFTKNPVQNIEAWRYATKVNQSLPAVLIRYFDFLPIGTVPTKSPFILAVIAGMTLITSWSVYRLPKGYAHYGFFAVLSLGLLIYPGTLTHYTYMLILPLSVAWSEWMDRQHKGWILLGALTVAFLFVEQFSPFWINLSSWLLMIVLNEIRVHGKMKDLLELGFRIPKFDKQA